MTPIGLFGCDVVGRPAESDEFPVQGHAGPEAYCRKSEADKKDIAVGVVGIVQKHPQDGADKDLADAVYNPGGG